MLAFVLAFLVPVDPSEWQLRVELSRFPPVPDCKQFWIDQDDWLQKRWEMGGHRSEDLVEMICQTRRIRHVWGLLESARQDACLETRWRWLDELRFQIGEEDWAAGRMPPICLYWTFARVER